MQDDIVIERTFAVVGKSALPSSAGLAFRPELSEAWSPRQRQFKIRAAHSAEDRQSARILVDKMYATRGYRTASVPEPDSGTRKTFLASDLTVAVGTITIGLDSADGLRVDELFSDEVDQIRHTGQGVCEFTKLAMDRRARSPRLLACLFHVAYLYAYRIKGLRHLLIEVNPRHVRYYEAMLGFEVVGPVRHNAHVNAPAVLLSLDLRYAERQISAFGGRPLFAASERSAYPYFFGPAEEGRITDRLAGPDSEIAHVLDLDPAREDAVHH